MTELIIAAYLYIAFNWACLLWKSSDEWFRFNFNPEHAYTKDIFIDCVLISVLGFVTLFSNNGEFE